MAHPLRMNIKGSETYCLQKLIKMHIDLYIFFCVIVGGGVDSYLKLCYYWSLVVIPLKVKVTLLYTLHPIVYSSLYTAILSFLN